MTKHEAIEFLRGRIIPILGEGYHPDSYLQDYINPKDGSSTFTEAELAELQPLHDQAMQALGDDVWGVALELIGLKWFVAEELIGLKWLQ